MTNSTRKLTSDTTDISPSISIVVPVYKSELFLKDCIDSILNQTYSDWELILIDDGSPDKSGTICDDFSSKDSRIKTIHQKNQGVSFARNAGISRAKGEYICFIDSDDQIETEYLRSFFLNGAGYDLYIQGYKIKDYRNKITPVSFENLKAIGENDIESIYVYAEKTHIFNSPWAKIFRRQLITDHHLCFDTRINLGEDHLFSLTFLLFAKTISFSYHSGYIYSKQKNDSLTSIRVNHANLIYYAETAYQLRLHNSKIHHITDQSFGRFIEAEKNVYILRAILSLIDDINELKRKDIFTQYLNKLHKQTHFQEMPRLFRISYAISKYSPRLIMIPMLRLYAAINKFRVYIKQQLQ